MFRTRLLWFLIIFVVCSYCGKDFIAPGRHQWRCKKRIPNTSGPNQELNITANDEVNPNYIVQILKCCCGKSCKGIKGLKMHRRRCKILKGLSEDQMTVENSNLGANSPLDNVEEIDISSLETVEMKPGVNLPKTNEQWMCWLTSISNRCL